MNRRQLALLFTLSLTWGASFLFIKTGVKTIPPLTFVTFRVGIAALILFGVLRWRGVKLPRDRRTWAALAFVGFINAALPYTLFAWGEQQMGANASGLASIYNATTPLWTVVLALLFVRVERLTPIRSLGVLIGFSGVVFLFRSSIQELGSLDTWGQIACLIAGCCYGIGTLYVRRKLGALPALVSAFGQMFTAALWLAPLALGFESAQWQVPALESVLALLALAILGTGIAQILYFTLVKQVGATRTAQVTYILPVFAILLGWLVLGEPLRADMFIGLAIILVGVIVVNGRWPFRRVRQVQPAALK